MAGEEQKDIWQTVSRDFFQVGELLVIFSFASFHFSVLSKLPRLSTDGFE